MSSSLVVFIVVILRHWCVLLMLLPILILAIPVLSYFFIDADQETRRGISIINVSEPVTTLTENPFSRTLRTQ